MGMLAFLVKFIPKHSELKAPLRELKTRGHRSLDSKAKQALTNVKKALTSTDVLKYFNATKPETVVVDASLKGLGSAILRGNER